MSHRAAPRCAPEVASGGDAAAHYAAAEAARYDDANANVQAELARRCADLLGLRDNAPALLLDAGCGSCLGWGQLAAHGGGGSVFCLGLDVSLPMLRRAAANGGAAHGDVVLCDLGAPLPLRRGCVYDGCVSVSALQWLCRSPPDGRDGDDGGDNATPAERAGGNKRHAKRALERRRKLARSGATLAADDDDCDVVDAAGDAADAPLRACLRALASRLVPGGVVAAQVYPGGRRQAAELAAAARATPGLRAAGLLADLPHSAVVAKRFLCLQASDDVAAGSDAAEGTTDAALLAAPPCPLSWPLQGGCAAWWRAAARCGAPGDAWGARLARWHEREARWQHRLARQPPSAAALPPLKQRALADEQARGRAKAARYEGAGCCDEWAQAVAAQQAAAGDTQTAHRDAPQSA